MGCHFLLQGIFPTQRSNPQLLHLLHCQVGSLPLASPWKGPVFLKPKPGGREDLPHTHSESSQSSGRLSLKEERRTLEISAGTEDKGQDGEAMGHSGDPEALQPGCAVGGDALGGQHGPECLAPSLLSPMSHRQEVSIQLSTHSKSVENGLKLNKQQSPDADKL